MIRTGELGRGVVDNYENIGNFLPVFFNHLAESAVDAGELVKGDVLFRPCLSVR